ncbi:MAG TPA: cytidine deaminase [Ktedonobacterales bacterium]|nr:cytidine deaminase [Ktedonobacterales bacterium]
MDRETLIEAARAAAAHAYAPYSKFRVGAAVVVETGEGPRVVTGANVENSSYGLTVCAERAALAAACLLAEASMSRDVYPKPTITHVAISCVYADEDADASERLPCGACRQWLAELAPRAVYYVDGIPDDLRLDDLLPYAFHLPD